jgi:tetratricopeptide (TPR) repeat protein
VLNLKHTTIALVSNVAIALSIWALPAWAGDPFRTTNPHPIGDKTEAAFRAIFEQGNYVEAGRLLETAEPNEPLAYALKASLAYINGDWNTLGTNATLTRETAERLASSDPLRSHLYTAVGLFLEGAHTLKTSDNTVIATPSVLGKLQQVFDQFNQAERIASDDPELNLIKGYMDLMLAVNLPFSNPGDAIERLEKYAAPTYLAQRGIAIGYRDLRQPDQAMTAVDRALTATPDNPDLFYLKAQILVRKGQEQESLRFFRLALAKSAQLPQSLINQIAWEQCRTLNRVRNRSRDCNPLLHRSRDASGTPTSN